MKKINFIFKALLLSGTIFLASCSDDNDPVLPKGDYENGILISGEGSGAGSGSVSYISDDYSTSESKIFNKVNSTELGTFLQSVSFSGDNAYIVVDNQNTVTIVNRYTFQKTGQITDQLSTPRYITVVGNRGYVTNWGSTADETDDFIAVIDMTTSSLVEKISVGNGPERIKEKDGKLYITHKGAFTNNNIVSVVDISTKNVATVTVKDRPDEMYFTSNNELVVLSEGRTLYDSSFNVIGHTKAAIAKINTLNNTVTSEIEFADEVHPGLMVINDNKLYYTIGSDVFSMDVTSSTLPSTKLLTAVDGFLYGFEVKEGKLYALDASFSDVSKLNIFDLSTTNKTKTMDAPLGASKIYFN